MKSKKIIVQSIWVTILLFLFLSFQANAQKKRLACVGNSITAGYGLSNPSKDSYPSQLLGLLGSDNWVVGNYGASGRTMLKGGGYSYWDDGQYTSALKSNPDFVIIGLGTNDSKDWLWNWLGADFKKDYKAMVQSFQELSSKPDISIFLLVPGEKPDWGIYNSYIDKVNVKIKELALEMGLGLIDLHSAFNGHFPEWFQPDSVHPAVEGATEIALRVKEMLLMSKPEIIYAHDSIAAPDGFDYQWYIDRIPVSLANGGKQKVMAATKTGIYKVSVKINPDSETRIVSPEVNVNVASGLGVLKSRNGIKIYPNPAFDKVFIESDKLFADMDYRITDVSGKTAISGTIKKGISAIDVGKLTNGNYLLYIENECVKFIKSK